MNNRSRPAFLFFLTLALLLSSLLPSGVPGRAAQNAPLTSALAAPMAPDACSTPLTQSIRGKNVTFDLCYGRTFTHDGVNYSIDVYYTETDSMTNLNQCTAAENAANRCEHAISNNDDGNGDNVVAVAAADEAETAMRFYHDRNLEFLPPGDTSLQVFIAEDPRLGGIPTCSATNVDDDLIDNNDNMQKRVLAFHEIQHLVQCNYDPGGVWFDFYGEGVSRAIEDRVETNLDANTGYLFIPEVNGILGNDGQRSSDLSTISYRSVLWWTWLMDQYRLGSEAEPSLGWSALRDFYLELETETDQLKAVRDYISAQGSSFRDDFTDYSLALYAHKFTNSSPRLDFIDSEINSTSNQLSGHNVLVAGPAFSTISTAMSPRSSRYWEFTPASQCDFIGFTFDGNGKAYGFSVMTVDSGGNLQKRWTSHSTGWARTVGTTGLSRVVGVVSAIDDSGSVDVGRGCVTPTINIKNPTSSQFEMVGSADNPRNFIVRVRVQGVDGSGVAGLTASDFTVQTRKAGGGSLINANILNAAYVQDDYWLLVRAPDEDDGAETGQFYDLIVNLGSISDTEPSALLYVARSQDVVVVLDRSGSMDPSTGKIQAARNAANLLVNELADTDQGAYVTFDTTAALQEGLAAMDAGSPTHREDLEASIAGTSTGGATSIGAGMEIAADEHDANKIPTNLCSFVLLSDGHENTAPMWDDVKAGVTDNGCALHTIALGPEANETLMQSIAASVPGGSYDYADVSGDVPILAAAAGGNTAGQAGPGAQTPNAPTASLMWQNNLSRVYDFKATQIAGRQRIQAQPSLGREIKEAEYAFYVDDAADQLVIALGWQFPSTNHFTELIDPNGNPAPGADHRIAPQLTNEVWKVTKPEPGKWVLRVHNLFQEYLVSGSVDSLYELYLFVGTPIELLSQGVQVPILASFVGPDGPITGADVQANIEAPNGALYTLVLHDDGNHGDGEPDDGVYGGYFTTTNFAENPIDWLPPEGEGPDSVGSYSVNVIGIKGDIRREAQGSFAIEPGLDENGNRLPDAWEKAHGVDDPQGDPDGDGLVNYCEFQVGTDPRNPDTDGGGETDGSEAPQCFNDPNGQDPLDPSDDRVGRLTGVLVLADLNLELLIPIIRIHWSPPQLGDLLYVDLYRRTVDPDGNPGPWELIAEGLKGNEYEDGDVEPGKAYEYRLAPIVEAEGIGPLPATVEQTGPVTPTNDPYAPGGSILINGGTPVTTNRLVTLELSADDTAPLSDGGPDQAVPGTPVENLEMRISNQPDFSDAGWMPFQPIVEGWDLGAVPPNGVATVYVQFRDEAGNVSESGAGLADTIIYRPGVFLPFVSK